MNDENVQEWLHLADDDLYSAKILSEAVRKPYANIVPIKKTHDLVFLYDQYFLITTKNF